MDFSLTEDQKMLKTMVRDFAETEVEPIAAQIDEEARFPTESIKKIAQLGLMGTIFPEEYGGSGGGETEIAIIIEEIARVCGSTAAILLASISLASYPIYKFGTEEQRRVRSFLPLLISRYGIEALPALSLRKAPPVFR